MRALFAMIAALTLASCDFASEPKTQEGYRGRTNRECAFGLTCRQVSQGSSTACRPG